MRSPPTPARLYIAGGQQREARSLGATGTDWRGYHRGLVVEVDTESRAARARLSYASPPDVCADEDPEILFQSGTIANDRLYICTGTEVLTFSVPEFDRIGYISLPWFNDVHHVTPGPNGTLLVANAGLEMVLEMTPAGEVLHIWNALGEDPWERFSLTTDYRKIASTKPHRSHPNYLFHLGNDIWATRFQQGDAVCLTDPSKRIQVSNERIHDGVVHEGRIYFTTVDGTVVVVDAQTLERVEEIRLASMHPHDTLLGWCRGIYIDGDRMWVGFSRIRPTKVRENVGWIMRGFRQVRGTHVSCYDLKRRVCIAEIELEPVGLNAVFGIFPAPIDA